jgi:hypothetical protein
VTFGPGPRWEEQNILAKMTSIAKPGIDLQRGTSTSAGSRVIRHHIKRGRPGRGFRHLITLPTPHPPRSAHRHSSAPPSML